VRYVSAMIEFVLPVVPLLALVVPLLFGFYPGCETAMRLADRITSRTRGRTTVTAPPPRRAEQRVAHGGLLLAFSLSGRAPPAAR
jgi:hypothetical protein